MKAAIFILSASTLLPFGWLHAQDGQKAAKEGSPTASTVKETFRLPVNERPSIPEDHRHWLIEVKPSDKVFESPKLAVTSPKQSFFISRFEATQALWKKVMESSPANFSGSRNLPVESVTWYEMLVFCNKLSAMDGLTPSYYSDEKYETVFAGSSETRQSVYWKKDADGYRLPTADEWVYAAKRGALSKDYPIAGASKEDIDQVAWYRSNSDDRTHEVAEKRPNELGLYDMAGNVFELCWDAFRGKPSSRVRHGSGWSGSPSRCAIMNRRGSGANGRSNYIGFRFARNANQ